MDPSTTVFVLHSRAAAEGDLVTGVRGYAEGHRLAWEVVPCPAEVPIYWLERLARAESGVVVGRHHDQDMIDAARARGLRWVAFGRDDQGEVGDATVAFDPGSIGRIAVEYLLAVGARSFAVQAPLERPGHLTRNRRHAGFVAALAAKGLSCRTILDRRRDLADDLESLREFAAAMPAPTGVFLPDDGMAEWMLATLEAAGLAVPWRFAVLGCGNTPRCERLTPTLSSVRLPHRALGEAAALQAHRLLSGDEPGSIPVPAVSVCERGSTVADRDPQDPIVDRALRRVARADRPIPAVAELAHHCRVCRDTLGRHFVRRLGSTPSDWLGERAMQRAASLLVETDRPLARIARSCGMRHDTHLIARFRTRFGITPGAYRRSLRAGHHSR